VIDPLRALFAYDGAVADGDDIHELAPEVYVTPFWTPEFCAVLIDAAEATQAFEPQPDDPVPGHEVSLAVISPVLFETVQHDLGARIWPRLQQHWPYIDYHGLRDAFVIKYALGQQESLRIHHDVAQVSASVKLNDDYRGSELVFPRQGFSNAEVAVGDLLAWPSLVTHPHAADQLLEGTKYSLTIWFELPSF
jgi:2OG-Fe(II) oxygenase superfamily